MKKVCFFCVFMFLFLQVNAQIENELKSYRDSSQVIINNGRKLILQSLKEGDIKKADETYQFLVTETRDSYYNPFTYTEELYINVLLGNWDNWLTLTANYNDYSNRWVSPENFPIGIQLYLMLKETPINVDYEAITYDDEKDIVDIFIYYLQHGSDENDYRIMYKNFKKKYKTSSVFETFLSKYLPYPYAKSALGFAMGSGVILPTGNLKSNFSPNADFTLSIDFSYGLLYTSLHMTVASLRLREPFNYKFENFYRGDRFIYTEGGILGGCHLLRSKRFQLTPYISLGGITMQSNLYTDERHEVDIVNSFAFGPGLHTEVKLMSYQGGYMSLKIDGGYNMVTKRAPDKFSGNVFYVKIGLVNAIGNF